VQIAEATKCPQALIGFVDTGGAFSAIGHSAAMSTYDTALSITFRYIPIGTTNSLCFACRLEAWRRCSLQASGREGTRIARMVVSDRDWVYAYQHDHKPPAPGERCPTLYLLPRR
jgi:hypothetical protein